MLRIEVHKIHLLGTGSRSLGLVQTSTGNTQLEDGPHPLNEELFHTIAKLLLVVKFAATI